MQAKIRAASKADLGALTDLEDRSFTSDRLSRRSLARLVASPAAAVLVAEADAMLAGYAAMLFRAGSDRARLYSIAVDPTCRGVGRQLLAEAEVVAARRGCAAMRLEVRADNIPAINLYERSGYGWFAEVANYYADGATAIRYEKLLPAAPEITRLSGTAAA